MRSRLALGAAAVTTTVALAFLVPLALIVRTFAEDRALARAELTARSLIAVVAAGDVDTARAAVSVVTSPAAQVAVHLPDGGVLGEEVPSVDVDAGRAGESEVQRNAAGAAVVVPVQTGPGEPAVVSVFVPDAELRRGVARAWASLAALGAALVLIAVALADRLGRAVVKPVAELADAARRLGEGDLSARVEPGGPPEIAEVGRVTNQLAERIGHLLAAERELVADLSHRLRTPLACLRLDAEQLGPGEAAERLREDVDLLERGLTDLIRQARRPQLAPARGVDLAAVVRERAQFWAVLAEEQGRPWSVGIASRPLDVAMHPEDAVAALDAILGNVFAHTPPDAGCRIALREVAGGAVLSVDDDGPGFAVALQARGASGGSSTGLGLDIARRAAESAGGRLSSGDGPAGGASVELRLPLLADRKPPGPHAG